MCREVVREREEREDSDGGGGGGGVVDGATKERIRGRMLQV